jgi:hypothetical protein
MPDPRTNRRTGRLQRRPFAGAEGTCLVAAALAGSTSAAVAGRTGRAVVGHSPGPAAGMGSASRSYSVLDRGRRHMRLEGTEVDPGRTEVGPGPGRTGVVRPGAVLVHVYLVVATAMRCCGAAWDW